VEIAGASHRDRAGFEKEFEKMNQALREKGTINPEESELSP
jgi:hypothetical protein